MKDHATDKRSPIIAVALIVTAVFLALFGWLLSRTSTCIDGWWLWDRLVCLDPNSLGDTFAGAFAPVAFVWLVAAVMLQRNELAAQRQELSLTREEFKLTRQEVAAQRLSMQEQVLESRKNVEFVEEQTLIQKANRRQDEQRAVDSRIFSLAKLARSQCYETIVKKIAVPVDPIENDNSRGKLALIALFGELGSDVETLVRAAQAIDNSLKWFRPAIRETKIEKFLSPENFGVLCRIVEKIDRLVESASDELQDSMEYLDWWQVTAALDELEEFLSSQDASWGARLAEWRAETPPM